MEEHGLALTGLVVSALEKAIPKNIEATRIARRIRLLRIDRSIISLSCERIEMKVEDFGETKSSTSGGIGDYRILDNEEHPVKGLFLCLLWLM
jgi:hypothetical protein